MTDIDGLLLVTVILTIVSVLVIMALFWITWSKIEVIYNILMKKWDDERNASDNSKCRGTETDNV